MPIGVYTRTEKTRQSLSIAKMGFKHSQETKEKMSATRKGKMPKNFYKFQALGQEASTGVPSWNKGVKFTDEQKEKLDMSGLELGRGWNKGMPAEWAMGEKNVNWKGGIDNPNRGLRQCPEYRLWKKSVFERDNYSCVWCGTSKQKNPEVILHADHIKSFADYPELRFAIDNGRVLCWDCHKKTDTYGGSKKNNNTE